MEPLVKLTQAGDVKTDFDQATLEICEDGDSDASSVQSDGGISNDKVSQQEEPPIEQIQSLMDMLSQQRFTQVYEQAQELTKQYSNNPDPLEHNGLSSCSKRAARPSSFCL